MSAQEFDQIFQDLIAKALIPLGFRPTNDADIEALLDTITCEQMSEDTVERILSKAKGEIAIGQRQQLSSEEDQLTFTEKERELLALHRSQGKDLSPEVLKKLEELRKKAREKQQGTDNDSKK